MIITRRKSLTTAVLCTCIFMPSLVGAQEVFKDVLYGNRYVGSATVDVKNANVQNASGSYAAVIGGMTVALGGGWGDDYQENGTTEALANKVQLSDTAINGASIVAGNWKSLKIDVGVVGGAGYSASNNEVVIDSGSVNAPIAGGYTYGKNKAYASVANGNKVVINGGDFNVLTPVQKDYGAGINGAIASHKNSSATGNVVEINGGNITGSVFGAFVNDGYNSVINNNVVYLNGGTIDGNVNAIRLQMSYGKANNNGIVVNGASGKLDLSKASLNGIYIGDSYTAIQGPSISNGSGNQYLNMGEYKGSIKKIAAFDNVEINNSNVNIGRITLHKYNMSTWNSELGKITVNDSVLSSDDVHYVAKLDLNNSSVKLTNVNEVYSININNSSVELGKATNFDEINITNQNDKTKNLSLGDLCGFVDYYDGSKFGVISTDSQFKADSIDGLKQLDVNMDHIKWQTGDVVIDVTGTADLTGTAVNVKGVLGVDADVKLSNGDRMSLIRAGELLGIKAENVKDTKLLQGFAKETKVELMDGINSIDFVITGLPTASEQTYTVGESRAAALAFVDQGSDVLNQAFSNLDDGKYGIKTFAIVHGNRSEYDIGNGIRVNGWSVLTGVGEQKRLRSGELGWGIFYEGGDSNYRTNNEYEGIYLDGYGSSVYNGYGAMLRYEAANGVYAELGARSGRMKNKLKDAFVDGLGAIGGYNARTDYYGAHAGFGRQIAVDKNAKLDFYGKYFYVYHDDVKLDILGDSVSFGSADSSRLRIGSRYSRDIKDSLEGYVGLAWEHEFGGDININAAGFDVKNTELNGDTAIVELGVKLAPQDSKWDLDLNFEGYLGTREGISGNLKANYNF